MLVAAVLTLSGVFCVHASEKGTQATFSDFKLPQYNDKGQLMFVLYGVSGYSSGIHIFLKDVLIDVVKSTVADIDNVADMKEAKVYAIDTDTMEVVRFWMRKPHCEALIASPEAVFDRVNQTIKGDDKIMFRSRFLDIDGVGFDGENQNRTIHIRKNVKVVVRYQFALLKKTAEQAAAKASENHGKIEEK